MKLSEIQALAIKLGRAGDFRTQKDIDAHLMRIQEKFEKLGAEEKKYFDREKLANPYLDSRIHFDSNREVKKVLAGIDIDTAELLLADNYNKKNPKNPIDAVIAHHPMGASLASLGEVMHLQADVLAMYGVPINVAENLLKVKISEVSRGVSPINHFQAVDAAKMLGISLMNTHTSADNLVASFIKNHIEKAKPQYVGEILKLLREIPEYQEAEKMGFGPRLFTGSEDNHAGKVAFSEITGGTEGSPKIYEKMAQAGVGTVIAMHQSEEHRKEAEAAHINVVIAGHISSDSLGMNLFLDELEKRGVEIIPVSGLIRVKRIKKKK